MRKKKMRLDEKYGDEKNDAEDDTAASGYRCGMHTARVGLVHKSQPLRMDDKIAQQYDYRYKRGGIPQYDRHLLVPYRAVINRR
jgi:hypothetical protein